MTEEQSGEFAGDQKVDLVAKIVSAYVSHNPVQAAELPALIRSVFNTLSSLAEAPTEEPPQKPAVPVRKSVTDQYIICLEDGRKYKSLRRHLNARYGMTPEEYREKWNLPADYPMVAPAYARQRSELAKKMGLGQSRSTTDGDTSDQGGS